MSVFNTEVASEHKLPVESQIDYVKSVHNIVIYYKTGIRVLDQGN